MTYYLKFYDTVSTDEKVGICSRHELSELDLVLITLPECQKNKIVNWAQKIENLRVKIFIKNAHLYIHFKNTNLLDASKRVKNANLQDESV